MTWKDKMKEWGGGDIAFLSEDGEAITFRVVGEPVLLEGKFKGRIAEKIGCPCITLDGFILFVMGKRLARKLSKYEDQFKKVAFCAIRHGKPDDINSTYEIRVIEDKEIIELLNARYNAKEIPALTKDAIDAALEVMNS